MKKRPIGTCRICGVDGKLTKEHIPPQAAFNDRRTVVLSGTQLINLGPDEYPKGPVQQGGVHDYTLCSKCNNDTGSWYGNHFVGWCHQGMEFLQKTQGKPTLHYLYYVFPLHIIKQIIVMFFSVNALGFGKCNPELVRFVLNKNQKYLSPKYRVFVYYNISNKYRYSGVTGLLKLDKGENICFSEINYPPFGYVLTYDSEPPDDRLAEITPFANYSYGEFKVLNVKLPVLDTHLAHPGDYRTKAEIMKNRSSQVRGGS